jgi:hypothetical protein
MSEDLSTEAHQLYRWPDVRATPERVWPIGTVILDQYGEPGTVIENQSREAVSDMPDYLIKWSNGTSGWWNHYSVTRSLAPTELVR